MSPSDTRQAGLKSRLISAYPGSFSLATMSGVPFSILHSRLSGKDFLQIGILESEVEIGMDQGKLKIKTKERANSSFSLSRAPPSSHSWRK